ncbi:phosphotransferase enzyme family protein [Dictyobacter aurantiacus]|uniref:Aminoglycoside phosphotransferase domain-containing protein n=1 Tax=Dictyobacter aurantiacus TaxID=1936993 RepID=A0A401ZJ05_9CHLR|nr:phosphotransferase [Dictyobacter aurantiacus]GCE06823.1 hypothetical protein KDAU_41520 [Dictyobacter aurantiacus]
MNEKDLQPTLESPFLVECIHRYYHAQTVELHRLPSDSGKYIFRVDLVDGTRQILRVVTDSDKSALFELTRLLQFFEQQDYPAERIILTTEQATTVTVEGWHLLLTTFLVGNPLEYTPSMFRLLGGVVGQLHALKPVLTYDPPRAGMLPSNELAFAQRQLDAVATRVPHLYIPQFDLLETTLSSLDRGTHLPTTLIHNDCHPFNAVMTAPGHVTLLDWEGSGLGPAVLDVAFLLSNCDGKAPWFPLSPEPFHPATELLQAVIEGYRQYHQLTTAELAYLADAIRFRSLVFGVCNFAAAIAQQQNAGFSQWWWTRYRAADEIADQARTRFEQLSQ